MKWSVFICLALVFASCNKDPIQYEFDGQITESLNGAPLAGADINIYHKPFNNSLSSNNYVLVGSTTTDASGNYHLSFDREKATEFKVNIQKEGYFKQDIIMQSGDVSSENINTVDAVMEPQSWIQLDIHNVAPSMPSDNLTLIFYTYRTGCDDCITSDYNYFSGEIDTVLNYQNTAGQYLKFTYIDVGGGQSNDDSLYMTPFDTVYYTINY